MDELGDRQRERLRLIHRAATYIDVRRARKDAVVLMEVIEHLEPERLPVLLGNVLGHARPGAVIITTPNVEYNPVHPQLPTGAMRHPEDRFEWTRRQLRIWSESVCQDYGCTVAFRPVGEHHPTLGSPTQLATFRWIELWRDWASRSFASRCLSGRVIRRQLEQLRRSLKSLRRGGFQKIHVFTSEAEISEARFRREPLLNDSTADTGPFDMIGDVPDCLGELSS